MKLTAQEADEYGAIIFASDDWADAAGKVIEAYLRDHSDLPADLAQQLVDAGLPTELDALWEWCEAVVSAPEFGLAEAAYASAAEYHVTMTRSEGAPYAVGVWEWFRDFETTHLDQHGATPLEAVARLALALHAKAGGE